MNTLTQQQPIVPIGLGSTETALEFEDGSLRVNEIYPGAAKVLAQPTLSELGVAAGDVVRFSADLRSKRGIKTRLSITPISGTPNWGETVSTEWTSTDNGLDDVGVEFRHEMQYEVPSELTGLMFFVDKPNSVEQAGGQKWKANGIVEWKNAKVEVPNKSGSGSPGIAPQSSDAIFGLPPIAVYAGGAVLAGGLIWAITSK